MIPNDYDYKYEVTDLDEALDICHTIKGDDKHFELIVREDKNPYLLLIEQGKTIDDVVDLIHSLKKEDYYSGPLVDEKSIRKRMLWVFKKEFIGKMMYIKFKIINKKTKMIVISLHEDENDD